MAGKKQSLEVSVLNAVLRGVTYTSPSTVYAALYTVAPTDSTGGTEVSDPSYARQAVTFSAPSGSPSSTSNTNQLDFPIATTTYTVVAVAICDASSGGNQLYLNTVTNKTINSGDRYQIPTGQFTITED